MVEKGLAVSEAESCTGCDEEFDFMLVVGDKEEYKWICTSCGVINSISDEETELEFFPTIEKAFTGGKAEEEE